MGEVYRARDTKLHRDVALKILPDVFLSDADRRTRFEREAHVLASLNHPNIAQIYGVEDSAGAPALVMEFVEGPTLEELLKAHPSGLPQADALSIARQIALALETAHEQGVIHRDLKPANVKVREDGTVKVLDFGLAKALDPAQASRSDAYVSSPTVTSPAAMTSRGVILGTAAYMSPEQARGRTVDKRADIWAFGVVFWEMLTGRHLFAGETMAETLASVIKDEPRVDALPASTPPAVRRVIARCLERDPKMRLRDIGEARIALDAPAEAAPTEAPGRTATSRRGLALGALAALALAAAVGVVAWRMRPAAPAIPLRRLDLPVAIAQASAFAIAPDGTRVAYIADAHLYVRAFDAIDPDDLGAVHVTADNLFWSPDSTSIAFSAESALHTIPARGGTRFTVCRVPLSGRVMGATWLPDHTIVFAVWRDGLFTVAAAGGTPALLQAIDPSKEIDFHEVRSTPDGRLIVHTHLLEEGKNLTELIDGKTRIALSNEQDVSDVAYAAPGFLLFTRSVTNAGLWAVPFTGGPIDFTKATLLEAGASDFNAANDGTLIFKKAVFQKSSLVWVDRTGVTTAVPGAQVDVSSTEVALSPDGRRAAIVAGAESTTRNIVIRDLATGIDTPLTFNGSRPLSVSGETSNPTWFPSGDRVVYFTGTVGAGALVERRADGAGDARRLVEAWRARVSADGHSLFFTVDERGRKLLRQAPIQPDGTLGAAHPVFSGANEPWVTAFDVSQDGALLAYDDRQPDSKLNIYVADLPGGTNRRLLADGGSRPRFSRDGHEIFFVLGARDADGAPRALFMSASVTMQPVVKIGVPAQMLDSARADAPRLGGYDVSPDSKRFLMWKLVPQAPGEGTRAVLVQNWTAAVGRK
jgi:serine/threonine-protein kinase